MVLNILFLFSHSFFSLLFSLGSFYWHSFWLTDYFLSCIQASDDPLAFFISITVFLISSISFWLFLLEYLSLYLSVCSYLFSTFSFSALSILITVVLNSCSDNSNHTCHLPSCNTAQQLSAQALEIDCLCFNSGSAYRWCNLWQRT